MVQIRVQPKVDGVSGWFATSADCRTNIGTHLEGEQEFDYAIIGGGFIGLSLAHRLIERQPQAKIAVIDGCH
ncbi:hypothetical protein [uncultured Bartonella sp.]|uniref:hypothetical protein n=1 Tax=uncultured Bartonella sp. TaxID=104108 RepID=UPI00262959DE|nr:hypothetical protein [uncultured Bartonella sp.]